MAESRFDRVKKSFSALHAADRLQFINSVLLVASVFCFLLIVTSFFAVVDFIVTDLPVAVGARSAAESATVAEFQTTHPEVGHHVRLVDAEFMLGQSDFENVLTNDFVTVLVTRASANAGGDDELLSDKPGRAVRWEVPSSTIKSLLNSTSDQSPATGSETVESGLTLDGVVTRVSEDSIWVIDASRVPALSSVLMNAALCGAGIVASSLLLMAVIKLRRYRKVLLNILQKSEPLVARSSQPRVQNS